MPKKWQLPQSVTKVHDNKTGYRKFCQVCGKNSPSPKSRCSKSLFTWKYYTNNTSLRQEKPTFNDTNCINKGWLNGVVDGSNCRFTELRFASAGDGLDQSRFASVQPSAATVHRTVAFRLFESDRHKNMGYPIGVSHILVPVTGLEPVRYR